MFRSFTYLSIIWVFLSFISCIDQSHDREVNRSKNNQLISYQSSANVLNKVKLLTWNIQDLGRTKDENEILKIAKTLKNYDIIAIQEVVAKDPKGVQTVAKIVDDLSRMGSKWDYKVSDPTKSSSSQASERYAFIWKTSVIKIAERPYLDNDLQAVCEREPFIGKFNHVKASKPFYVVNFHSKPYNKSPELEIIHFNDYQRRLKTDLVFICGDFNLDEKHSVWKDFYVQGYQPSIQDSPTTLKKSCKNGNYLNHSIDNIYFDSDIIQKINADKVDFVNSCDNLETARGISDHLPVFLEFSLL